ncbi:MAG TPA: DUF2062 domain-containing protein [Steroidobacteraceae bacterium]|nr:DUF2062 domain-containing protein [Steroidobacteraceae bacterium]
MPRRLLKRIAAHPHLHLHLRLHSGRWYLRGFAAQLTDPRLWSPQRRCVTAAFGAGLAISFVPLPVHVPLAVLVAIVWRINLPTTIAATWIVNPFTIVPMYYAAYRLGAAITGVSPRPFGFRMGFEWLERGLGPIWKPFLVGCLAAAILCGALGWLGLELIWRWRVVNRRYRVRRADSTAG